MSINLQNHIILTFLLNVCCQKTRQKNQNQFLHSSESLAVSASRRARSRRCSEPNEPDACLGGDGDSRRNSLSFKFSNFPLWRIAPIAKDGCQCQRNIFDECLQFNPSEFDFKQTFISELE